MASEWYTIQTLSGQEQKAERSLHKRIAEEEMSEYINEVLVPMEKVVEVRGGKKTVTQRKLYPGYIFIDMQLYDEEKRLLAPVRGSVPFQSGLRPALPLWPRDIQ